VPAGQVAETVFGHAKLDPGVPPGFATAVALQVPAAQLPPHAADVYAEAESDESYHTPPGQLVQTVFAVATHCAEVYFDAAHVEQVVQMLAPVPEYFPGAHAVHAAVVPLYVPVAVE
jgi:hypothetical protein